MRKLQVATAARVSEEACVGISTDTGSNFNVSHCEQDLEWGNQKDWDRLPPCTAGFHFALHIDLHCHEESRKPG